MDTIGSEIKIDSLQTEVNFSIKGESEVVLHIVDDMNTNVKYKLVIGGQENTVTYLSEITKGEEDYYKRKYLLLNSRFFPKNGNCGSFEVLRSTSIEDVVLRFYSPLTQSITNVLVSTLSFNEVNTE